ncbi:MAG: DUF937 domain-containing protein, partial [Bacteroidota bacterium]
GEDAKGITEATSVLIPTILGGLHNKSPYPSTFGNIFQLLKYKQHDGWIDNLEGLVGGGNLAHNDPKDIAGNLMGKLFGSKVGGIIDLISSIAGIKKSASSGLMGMAGPLVISYLGRKIRREGLDTFGLSKFLVSQSTNIASALPIGMGDLIGFAKGGIRESTSRSTVTTSKQVSSSSSEGNKWLWPLLIAALAAGTFYWIKSCEKPIVPKVAEQIDKIKNEVNDAVVTVADTDSKTTSTVKDTAKNMDTFVKKKLACGIELNLPKNSTEEQLITLIEDANKTIDKETWFNLDRLTFSTGSANLDRKKSAEQLDNIAKIMECYPAIKVKIGGYTDNTGDEAANKRLSQNRANAVMVALAIRGVTTERMTAEGYGISHPMTSNDTEEGRTQNRRIALRLTDK